MKIHYEIAGKGPVALFFIHGWMGNCRWWDAQRDYFKDKYTILQMDLPGHGKSDALTEGYSSTKYAKAIADAANNVKDKKIVLIGHSMSGAYVLEAFSKIPEVKGIVIVDTLKDFGQLPTLEQVESMLFIPYRNAFEDTVRNMLPTFLFDPQTPALTKDRLLQEFLNTTSDHAIEILAPLYKMDVKAFAKKIHLPVRAINSDFIPTNVPSNRQYFSDYECFEMSGTGHYPMLERPGEFNLKLEQALGTIPLN